MRQLNVEIVEYEDPLWASWNKYEPRVSSYREVYIRERLRTIIIIFEISMIFFRGVGSVSYRDSWKEMFWAWQMGYSVMLSSRPWMLPTRHTPSGQQLSALTLVLRRSPRRCHRDGSWHWARRNYHYCSLQSSPYFSVSSNSFFMRSICLDSQTKSL